MEMDTTQSDAEWGLDRIDQRDLPLDEEFNYAIDGSGTSIFILDTGIRTTHSEFGGRASCGKDVVNEASYPNCADGNGHGTHCA